MLTDFLSSIRRLSPGFRRFTWKHWYQYLAKRYRNPEWKCMNYGYAALEPGAQPLELAPEDEDERYSLQLYHRVATAVDLAGRDVLEVGSGRGGGCYYLRRYLSPRSVTGVDLSPAAAELCNRRFVTDGLSFRPGDAEVLPFDDGSFDAVLNVESSHCYGSMERFLAEVRRVLRLAGHLLFADHRDAGRVEALRAELRGSGMEILRQEDVTPNVLAALDLDGDRKAAAISRLVVRPLVRFVRDFAGVEGTRIYRSFQNDDLVYLHFVLGRT